MVAGKNIFRRFDTRPDGRLRIALKNPSMLRMRQVAIGAALLFLAPGVYARQPIVYPAKGQSNEQQNRDDGECYVWARQSTGIDPAADAADIVARNWSIRGGDQQTTSSLTGRPPAAET